MSGWTEWAEADLAIKLHVVVAVAGIAAGSTAFLARKGTPVHRQAGQWFAGAAVLTALTSFLIHEIRVWGLWSPIHLLSIFTLVMVWIGVSAIRAGQIKRHEGAMTFIFVSGFIVAAGFTLVPDRLLGEAFVVPALRQMPFLELDGALRLAEAAPALAVLVALLVYRGPLRRTALRRWRARG